MLEELINQKKTDSEILSKQFDQWLYKDRGRKIRGIEYFLNQRSENIDKLIRFLYRDGKLEFDRLVVKFLLKIFKC